MPTPDLRLNLCLSRLEPDGPTLVYVTEDSACKRVPDPLVDGVDVLNVLDDCLLPGTDAVDWPRDEDDDAKVGVLATREVRPTASLARSTKEVDPGRTWSSGKLTSNAEGRFRRDIVWLLELKFDENEK